MKSFYLIYSTLLQSALQNWLQVVFTLLAIIVGTAGLSSVLVLNNAAQSEYQSMGSNSLGLPNNINAIIQPKNADIQPLTAKDYSTLRQFGFTNIVAYSQIQAHLADDSLVNIVGVDAPALALFADPENDPLGLTESLLLSPDLYARTNANESSALALTRQLFLPNLPQFEATTRPSDGEHLIVMDLYYFATFIEKSPLAANSTLGLEIAVIDGNEAMIKSISEAIPAHLQVTTVNQPIDPAAVTQSLHLNLLAMSTVMFAVCFFVVINALNLLLVGRSQLFKTLRQLGISRQKLVVAQVVELAMYAIVGACIGVFAGHYLAVLLAPSLALTLAGLFNVNLGFMQLNSIHLALPMIVLCFVAMLLAALLPYRQLNNELRQRTFSQRNPSGKQHTLFWLFLSALMLTIVIAGWASNIGDSVESAILLEHSLTATFVTIGCLIATGVIGLFWIYPIIIGRMTETAEHGHPLWHWSFAHSLIVANKTKLASAAFMIALVTHIGMNLMVGSFRDATNAWLEQRLVADYYVYADSADIQAAQLVLEEKGIRHFARYQVDTQVSLNSDEDNRQQPIRVYSYPHQNEYPKALLVELISQDAWQTYQQQTAVFINQQFAIRNNISLNDSIQIDINGTSKTMNVKAIYMDYGNPYAQALIAPEAFKPKAKTRVMAIHSDGTNQLSQESLVSMLTSTANVYAKDDILRVSMQAFDKTFLITDALNLVTLLVAVFSLTTSIILLEQKNRYVSALIRSFGVSKTHFTLALFSQYALLCLIAAVWAVPAGIAFAWLLVTRLNVFAFQWKFPLEIDVSSIMVAVSSSLLFVLALAAIPIFRRQKFSISEQLTCKE